VERKQQIRSWLKEILEKNLQGITFNAFIFGSQANQATLTRSDIDVGIQSDEWITPLQLSNIIGEIEQLPMLYRIDLVNFKEVDDQFKAIALQNTERL